MTRIDFYILPDQDLDARHRFACRLSSKAIVSGTGVHLHSGDADHARALDELLWQYPDGRFLPHRVLEAQPVAEVAEPITIGASTFSGADDLLINLAPDIPKFFGRFARVAEIVVQCRRDEGRERYKWYRDRGYPLFHHELNDWEN